MPETKTTQINLAEVVNNYLMSLQRVYDVMTYNLAAERVLNEQEYENFSRSNRVMPFQQTRMDYNTVKEETETWLLKHTLNEILIVLALFLDDCRTISTLASWQSQKSEEDIQKVLEQGSAEFAQLDLPAKMNYFKEKHSLSCGSEDHILSLYNLRNALANPNAAVSEKGATEGKLVLKLRSVQLKSQPAIIIRVASCLPLKWAKS